MAYLMLGWCHSNSFKFCCLFLNKMSYFVFNSLNKNYYHIFKLGDDMEKIYNHKKVKFSFFYDKNGKSLKDILEKCYREEIRNEQILTGGVNSGFPK